MIFSETSSGSRHPVTTPEVLGLTPAVLLRKTEQRKVNEGKMYCLHLGNRRHRW